MGMLCFFDVLLDNPVLVKTRLLIREYGEAMLRIDCLATIGVSAFFGALTSVGALFIFRPRGERQKMKYCSKCGAELHGNFCSECGHNNKVKTPNKALEWLREKWEKYSPYVKAHKRKFIIGSASLLLVLVTLITAIAISGNIYRAGKVSKIEIGMDASQVERILGEPTEEDGYTWYWYEEKVARQVEKAETMIEESLTEDGLEGAFEIEEKYSEIYEKINAMTFKFIVVRFDSENKVSEVFFDKEHHWEDDDFGEELKTVKKMQCELSSVSGIAYVDTNGNVTDFATEGNTALEYSVRYKDGSFYRGSAWGHVEMRESDSAATLTWKDDRSETELKSSVTMTFKAKIREDGALLEWNEYTEELIIPSDVTKIGANVICENWSVKKLILPSASCEVDLSNFTNCRSLEYNEYSGGLYVGTENNPYAFLASISNRIEFKIHKDCVLKYNATYTLMGNYIFFGEYPQTLKADAVTISATQDYRGYYLGSDGSYYAKVVANPWSESYSFSTGDKISSGSTYYFKVEPIRWRMLSTDGETALILCDSIIANKRYDDSSNDYANSEIRKWLNDTFYKTAFNELQREIILTTIVDNTNVGKIFPLSYTEVTNSAYGFSSDYSTYDTARRMKTSDYSRATGVSIDTDNPYYRNSYWWLRSSHDHDSIYARCVYSDGYVGNYKDVRLDIYGVVPALRIRL